MSTIVVGDLHGRVDILNEVLKKKDKKIVFVGDYLDSFDRSSEEQLDVLGIVLNEAKSNPNVQALWGNHEFSYVNPHYRCSGFNYEIFNTVEQYYKELMHDYLQRYAVVGDYLVTHAGVSNNWFSGDINAITRYIDQCTENEFNQVGRIRGGCFPVGGPIWCDSHYEFQPISGTKQVFGHTEYRSVNERKGIFEVYPDNWNVDCFRYAKEILEIDGSTAKVISL